LGARRDKQTGRGTGVASAVVQGLGLALLALASGATMVRAEPLDLQDPTARWIDVRFEVSPADEPGRLDSRWSSSRVAYLESDPEESIVHIRVPTDEIEAHLRTTGRDAIPGSFSDFVWTLDARTGHVLAAELRGQVRERFSLGPIRSSALVEIHVEMTTRSVGGYLPGRGLLGMQTNTFCAPTRPPSDCVSVDPVRFDPQSGYVNAVGSLVAATGLTRIRAFSPLGEVQFRERAADAPERAVSGTSSKDAVCSAGFKGSCWADLGGES